MPHLRVTPETAALGLVEALGWPEPAKSGLISIVGGGGKSSLMFALGSGRHAGNPLPGRVVMTTTTRIFSAQMNLAETACTIDDAELETHLQEATAKLLVVGGVDGERATGVPIEFPATLLARKEVDWVVVEADGSRRLPVKAPAPHEPVVPKETTLLVAVVGIDALEGRIGDVAHRPERVSTITGLSPGESLTPGALAALLASPLGGCKSAPDGARILVVINKVDSSARRSAARRVAEAIPSESPIHGVAMGALQGGATWELHTSARS